MSSFRRLSDREGAALWIVGIEGASFVSVMSGLLFRHFRGVLGSNLGC